MDRKRGGGVIHLDTALDREEGVAHSGANSCSAGTRLEVNSGACSFYFEHRMVNWLMNSLKKVVNLKMNRVNDEPKWLTLQEASRLTGLNTFTIRKRIKSGKLSGKKVNQKGKEVWFVSVDDIRFCEKVDNERLKSKVYDEHNGEPVNDELVNEPMINLNNHSTLLLQEKDERIHELVHHKGILEHLLKDFQVRMMSLEAERNELDRQVKLLPAPIDQVAMKLQEADLKEQALMDSREAIARLEEELRQERTLPWWKKMFKKR